MGPGDQYRARAKECLEAADAIADRENLVELAQRWLMLAEQVEGIQGRNVLMDDLGQDRWPISIR